MVTSSDIGEPLGAVLPEGLPVGVCALATSEKVASNNAMAIANFMLGR